MLQDVRVIMRVIEEKIVLLDAEGMCAVCVKGFYGNHGNYMV